MYCFDTSIIVALLRGDGALKQRISAVAGEDLSFTWITLCELYKGVYLSSNVEQKLQDVGGLLPSFSILDFSQEVCTIYGKEYVYLESIGKMTEEMDLLIAAIAKAHGATLVTRNKKHFEHIRGLKVEEW